MAAKRIQLSVDAGTTYKTIPGSQGSYDEELATTTDTVFGQSYESNDVSVGMWNVSCNAFFKGVQGYIANLLQQGTPTTMTTQPLAQVSGNTYRIVDQTKRIIDYFSSVSVFDGVTDVTGQLASIDYLNGTVTLGAAPGGAVTLTGKYVPVVTIARAKSFTLNMTSAEEDTTDYDSARTNGGWKTFDYGLKTVTMDTTGTFALSNGAAAALAARAPIVIECRPDNSTDTFFRDYFKRTKRGQSGNVGALEEETQTFSLWVPDGGLVVRPFGWYFSNQSQLNPILQNAIGAWMNGQQVNIRYQDNPDNVGAGRTGAAIITECSLKNTLEGLNEFTLGFRGSGAPTAY